jgi:hypothetical protein
MNSVIPDYRVDADNRLKVNQNIAQSSPRINIRDTNVLQFSLSKQYKKFRSKSFDYRRFVGN